MGFRPMIGSFVAIGLVLAVLLSAGDREPQRRVAVVMPPAASGSAWETVDRSRQDGHATFRPTIKPAIQAMMISVHPADVVPPKRDPSPAAVVVRTLGEGRASYYGRELAGHPTASGEPFDPSQFTAAHPSLPFGTRVRVTNLGSRLSVIVRVNDRGPFIDGRIIDISSAAAREIGMYRRGIGNVRIEVVE